MEAGRARRNRDDRHRLPSLSLGLSSVRLIVTKLESEYTRLSGGKTFERREIIKYDSIIINEKHDDFLLGRSSRQVWNRLLKKLGLSLYECIPSVSYGHFGILAVTTGLCTTKMISYLVLYPFCRLVFGTLYPAYASYKAVRTKNLKEYVKWMMYWIVFALFTCTETFTDVFLSWFPFYYEVKIVLVLWLLSPATKGSSILYRKFVHPALCRREQEIDEYIAKAKDQGYHTVLNLGTKGVNYATTVIMQTAIKGGGGLVQQLRKSYSLSDLTECEPREERGSDEADDVMTEPRLIKRGAKSGFSTRRSASESNSRQPMYFPEVDVDVRGPRTNRMDEPDFSHIKSSEDISSGYSSADNSASLTRAGSLGAASTRARARTARTTVTPIKRPQAAEEIEVIAEEQHDNDNFTNKSSLIIHPSPLYLSDTDPPFLYQYIGDKVKIVQILGDSSLENIFNSVNNHSDHWDQKEVTAKEAMLTNTLLTTDFNKTTKNDSKKTEIDTKIEYNVIIEDQDKGLSYFTNDSETLNKSELKGLSVDLGDKKNSIKNIEQNIAAIEKDGTQIINVYDSNNDDASAESDDEASFGTPDNSPRNKRKSPKGKYGKTKAPLPPQVEDNNIKCNEKQNETHKECAVCEDNTVVLTSDVKILEDELSDRTPIEVYAPEKKRRHKSKSPVKSSGISKLLQLPAKLAFWNRNDELQKSDDSSSASSSRRSSFTDKMAEDFQSCSDLSRTTQISERVLSIPQIEITNVEITCKNDTGCEAGNVNEIKNECDSKHEVIESKYENNFEYKYIPLHDKEIATTSKSTDV